MPRISTTKKPSVESPSLLQSRQNINVPRGAFGEDVGSAINDLGKSGQLATQQIGNALIRRQQRRDITEAFGASKDIPITALADLEDAKKAARLDPNLLHNFTQNYLTDFDNKTKLIRDGLSSDNARLRFDQNILATRRAMGKNAIIWANTEEIFVGRNNMNEFINSETKAAGQDIVNLDIHKQNVINKLKEADIAGFLIDGRGRKIDIDIAREKALRDMDLEVSRNLIMKDPVVLGEMIKNGQLENLTSKDKASIESDISKSIRSIDERRVFSQMQSTLARYPALNKKFRTTGLEASDIDALVAKGELTETAARVWRNEVLAPEPKTEAQIIEEGIRKGVIRQKIKEGVAKATGKIVKPKLSDPQKAARKAALVEVFTEDLKEILQSENINSIDKLNSVLTFADKVFVAQEDGVFAGNKAAFDVWMEDIIPSMTAMVDSKYLESFGREGLPLGLPFIDTGIKVFGKPKNIYATNYLAANKIFKDTAPTFALVDQYKIELMSKVLVLLKKARIGEGVASSLKDELEHDEFKKNIPKLAVKELMQELDENGNYENLNQIVRGVNFQAAPSEEAVIGFNQEKQDRIDALFRGE